MKTIPSPGIIAASLGLAATLSAPLALAEPLESWNDSASKKAIIEFVENVTDPDSDDFVPEEQRIAVFDNDGTLWTEQPMYFQLAYALDRAATADESRLDTEIKKAAANGDIAPAMAAGMEGLAEVIAISHADISVDDFQTDVRDWLANARHPDTDMAYTDMIFQPMLELLDYLRDEDFDTYIVSGGGVHFMRAFATEAYGIAPQNIIGSRGSVELVDEDGTLTLMKRAGIDYVDDGPGKPVAIDEKIGLRPIMAVGNSDGDVPMLTWSTQGDGPRLGVLVHHTDGKREVAYDRDSHFGKLDKGLDEAADRGWVLVDMANDWSAVYPEAQ
ncbi:HAD family hydrolase [Halomonas binhaiensis]|uniref:phosphoserine phosphatase n=1 Tax=Halomonas binhaiensis TaxID=2562282 RepID=A0A5C1NFA7_9GAMM|nr:HAD family hydrolase [Halomonas binhaiensis]QEM80887.1 haloacid dehalogenase-like hydrolase [Halomonas binhaiensis]